MSDSRILEACGGKKISTGELGGVPNIADAYFGELDKKALGLRQARVDAHRGLVFATWDEHAPSLADYLGDMRWYLDIALDRCAGGSELVGPAQRFIINANWKTGAENFISDFQHAQSVAHASAFALRNRRTGTSDPVGCPAAATGRLLQPPSVAVVPVRT